MIHESDKENSEKKAKVEMTDGNVSSYKWIQDKYGNWNLEKIKKEDPKECNQNDKKAIEKNEIKTLDNTQRIKQDTFVMTEWGVGKVNKIEDEIATVIIEGQPVEFPKETLTTSLPVFLCILCKEITFWVDIKVEFFYNIATLKSKIAQFIKCHHSQIIIIHHGLKVDKKSLPLIEMGIYERDVILVVIKDPQELNILR